MDKANEEYRRLEREYEFLSNLINNYRNGSSAKKEGLQILPRKSCVSVAKNARLAVEESQSHCIAGSSPKKRLQSTYGTSNKIKPSEYSAANERENSQKSGNLNLQTPNKGHQFTGKSTGRSDQLRVVNKYKLVRPNSENGWSQVQPSVPRASQVSQIHSGSKNENPVKSSSSFCKYDKMLNGDLSAKDVVIHKSKYKLVKTEQGKLDAGLTKIKPSSQNLPKTNQYRNISLSSLTSCSAAKSQLIKSSTHLISSPVVSSCKTFKKVSYERCRLMRKASKFPTDSALLNGQLVRNARAINPYKSCLSSSRPKQSWISKYSLHRQDGEISKHDNCINMILGRKVSNISSNKYKFINAKPARSSRPAVDYTFKRKTHTIERLPSLKATRFSCLPRYRFAVRKWNHMDTRLPLKRKRNVHNFSSATPSGDASVRYCLYYNRFGRCSRGDQCQYIHDPDKISVCTRFLRGTCKITDCPFSHKVAKHKMPMCRFFLRRACHREDCPYSHVNVGKDAEICLDFIRGFCTSGDSCKKKHMLICSDFAENGACPRGNDCPMRHPKKQQNSSLNKAAVSDSQCSLAPTDRAGSVTSVNAINDAMESSSDYDDVTLEWKERRLPAFIALDSSKNSSLTSTVNTCGASGL